MTGGGDGSFDSLSILTTAVQGIARQLVDELEKRFELLGCPRVNLLVLPDNLAGLRFWQALGYLPAPDVLCTKPMQIGEGRSAMDDRRPG